MRLPIKFLASLLILFTVFTGCTNQPPEKVSDLIVVSYLSGPEIRDGETLSMLIENRSSYCFDFSPDYNIVINVDINGEWIEIPNNIKISGNKPDILMPNGNPASGDFIDALPDLSKFGTMGQADAYILIVGHLCDDEGYIVEKKIPFVIVP